MPLLDKNIANAFLSRITRLSAALESEDDATKVMEYCQMIENAARALRKLAQDEIKQSHMEEDRV